MDPFEPTLIHWENNCGCVCFRQQLPLVYNFLELKVHFGRAQLYLTLIYTLPFPPSLSSIYILLSLITFNDDNLDEHDDDGTADDYEYRIKVLYFELELTKGRVPLPNRMNFRKNSKQPLTPPPSFCMLQIFYNGYGSIYARRYEGQIV